MVFGCVVLAFFGFRSLTVPASFGKQGHFRYAALADIAAHPAKFEGKQPCIDCHANNSPHTDKGVACESCHGPGAAHSADFDSAKLVVNTTRAACGTCHAMTAGRRDTFPQVDMADHHPSQRCVECHKIHPEDAVKPAAGTKAATSAKPVEPTKPAQGAPTKGAGR